MSDLHLLVLLGFLSDRYFRLEWRQGKLTVPKGHATLHVLLPADATRAQLLDAMKDVIFGKAAYFGRFHQ